MLFKQGVEELKIIKKKGIYFNLLEISMQKKNNICVICKPSTFP